VVSSPGNRSVYGGASTTLAVSANGATGFQWFFNGDQLAGATNNTLTLVNIATNQAGIYKVAVSNPAGARRVVEMKC
jgi:membrane carboxypeptidase/penicillin-binding protein PbpC